jgi:hypothetical protein
MEERNMSSLKAFAVASCLGLFVTALTPNAKADEWNKRTILTVNQPIQVPNKVLQPGKYVMKLADSPSNRHIVQIFDGNEQHLITTILAIPNYRLQPTGKTQFTFWETPAGQPRALRSWFYPGDNFGQEFAYPKNEAVSIAAAAKQSVPTTYAQSEKELSTARVGSVSPSGTESELNEAYTPPTTSAQTQTRPQQPVQMAQNRPPAAQPSTQNGDENTADRAATPQTMPRTASPYPLIGLIGMVSLGAYGVLTILARRA